MIDYDSDDSSVEFLIRHMKLADVEAFVVARDEVRRIPSVTVDPNDVISETHSTIPAAVGRVDEPGSGVVVRTMVELEIESVG